MTISIRSSCVELDSLREKARHRFEFDVDGVHHELWYEVDGEWADSLLPNRCDSALVTLLIHAVRGEHDIVSEVPASEELLFKLKTQVIPQMTLCGHKREIRIECPPSFERFEGNYVATGISCGVDSLSTLYENTVLCESDLRRVTHGVYFKVGAHDGQLGVFDKDIEDGLFSEQLEVAQRFCINNGIPLVVIVSNALQSMTEAFGFCNYDIACPFRNAGAMLVLQSVFRFYYYASTYNFDSFFIDLDKDSAHYSKWLLPNLSTESLHMYEANGRNNRLDKERELADFPPSHDSLLVCWTEAENCGHCAKCLRTLAGFDLQGVLDRFGASFDLDDWYKNRERYLARICAERGKDYYFKELYDFMVENKSLPPCGARILASLRHNAGRVRRFAGRVFSRS